MQKRIDGVFLPKEMLQSLNWKRLSHLSRGVLIAAASLFLSHDQSDTGVEELSDHLGMSIVEVVKCLAEIQSSGFVDLDMTNLGRITFRNDAFSLFPQIGNPDHEHLPAATVLGSALRKSIPIHRANA